MRSRSGGFFVRRSRLWLIGALALLVVLGLADPAEAAPKASFPLPSLASLERYRGLLESPTWTGLPSQRGGTPDATPHVVPGSKTRVGKGSGHKPGVGKGALPEYQPYHPKPVKGRSDKTGGSTFNPKTSTMDAAKSSANMTFFHNADGSVTRNVSEFPTNYQRAKGQWAPIDTTLDKKADGQLGEKANSLGVTFAPQSSGSGELVDVAISGSQSVEYSLEGSGDVTAAVDGSTATYKDIQPHTTLTETAGPTGVKEGIVLDAPGGANARTFDLRTADLTAALDKDGGVTLTDAEGASAGRIPPAFAYDSKVDQHTGDPATTWDVHYGLTGSDGDYRLTVTVDSAWLADRARAYPVTIDPTLSTSGTVSTTYAVSDSPGDFSSDTTIKTGDCLAANCGGTESEATGYLKFPGFPDSSGYDVSAASVHLYNTWTAVTSGTVGCTSSNPSLTWSTINVAPITQAWSVTGAKAYSPGLSVGSSIGSAAPATFNACTNTANSSSVGDWVSVPISNLTFLNDWSYGVEPDYGLAVYGATGALTWRKYDSDMESSFSPYLSVTYADHAPQVNSQYPPNGYDAPTLTPELLAAATKPSDTQSTAAITYDFTVFDDSGATVVDSGSLTKGDYVVPSGKLKWGQTYYWTVSASDGIAASVPKPDEALTTTVPQPVITSSLSQSGDEHGFDDSSGNYTTEATDADVNTVGPALQVVRDYNSRDPRTSGAFGAAWSSVFDAKATEQYNPSGAVVSVTVTYPDGSQVGFGKNTDGTFSPPAGRFAMLRVTTSGTTTTGYTLTDKDDTTYTFGTLLGTGTGAYGITAVSDASGRSVAFARTGTQITTMTSSVSGRALHLTWSTATAPLSPHVLSVTTDPSTAGSPATAETWNYFYSGDRLMDVCDPTASAGCTGASTDPGTRYVYADGSQYGSAVLDADAHSFWPLSESSGTTANSSVIVNENSDHGTYSNVTLGAAGPLPAGTATAASFNGTSSSMQLPSNLVASASFQSVGLWFKTSTAGVLLSYQADAVTTGATTTSNYTPAMYVGTSGKLYAEFWNSGGVNSIVTSASVADAKWHYALLSGAGNAQSLYLDGKVVNATPLAGTIAPFNGSGTAGEYVGAGFWGGGWKDEPHTSTTNNTGYASFFNGSIADVQFFTTPLVAADVAGLNSAATSKASLLTQITRPSGKTYATVTYDPSNARVTQVVDENGGTWTLNPPAITGTSEAYRSAVMGSAPAGYYRFADSAGATNAYSETNFGYGTYNNVTLGVPGPFDDHTAASFDGSSSFVSMPSTDQIKTGPDSVELWFNMTAGSTDGGVLFDEMGQSLTGGTPTASGWNPGLYVGTDGRLHGEMWMGNAGKALVSGLLVNDGKWHHAVIAASTSSQTLYLDGNAVGTLAGALVDAGLTNVYVGAGESGGTWPFHPDNTLGYFPGSIGDVSFYHSQLSAAEVAAHYTAYGAGHSSASATQVNKVVSPSVNTETYKYDVVNGDRLISETDGPVATTTYGYDTSGFLHTTTDPNGDVTITGHDVRGNTVSQATCQDQANQKCSTEYFTYWPDDTTAVLPTADPRNDLTTSFRDGRSASATDNTYATTYTYDTAGNRTAVTTPAVPGSPGGRTTTVTYADGTATYPAADSGNVPKGLPLSTVSPGGAVSRIAYLHNGDVASTTDANGMVTVYTYDNLGRVVAKNVNPGSPVGWWKLNQTSATAAVADSSGVGNGGTASNVTWSGGAGVFNGTSSQVVTPAPVLNTSTSFTMSAWANLSSIPTGNEVVAGQHGINDTAAELTYDPSVKSWKFQTTSADVNGGASTPKSFWPTQAVAGTWYHLVGAYDATTRSLTLYVNGTPATSVNATGAWTGAKNLTIGSTGGANWFPGSIENVQVYQRVLSTGEITSLFNAGRAGTTTASTSPNGLITTLGYDAAGQVVTQTDPTVTNRVTGAAHTATTSTGYDADGNVTSQTVADSAAGGDASRTVSSTYNQYDEADTTTDALGDVTHKTYDSSGDLATETSPDGDVTSYTYDADGRMLTQSLSNYTGDPVNPVGAHSQVQITKAYDEAGRLAIQYDAMNNATEYRYTDNGLVASVTRETLDSNDNVTQSFTLESDTYDAAGNVIEKDTGNWATATKSTYDAADRTTKVTLDPTGENRTTTVSYTPDDGIATSNETDGKGADRTTSYTYDAMGNALSTSVDIDGTGHPLGWYRLDQSKGATVSDSSGTGNEAVATGALWTGSSATFSGVAGQQIATNGPVLATTAPYSISAWVNLAATPTANQGVVSQDGVNASAFSLQYNQTDHGWAFAQAATDTSGAALVQAHTSTAPTAGTWYHLVGTYDSSSGAMKLYVNNSSTPATGTNTAPFAASGATVIGRDKTSGAASDLLNGAVSDVQIYNRVLSPAEVNTLYLAGHNGGTAASSNEDTTSWSRDIRGLPIAETDADGNTTDYSYDEAGHLGVTVAPAVSAETYATAAAQVRPVTTDGYNTFGEETQSEDADGNITNTVYDAEGNQVSQKLPNYTPPGSSTPITATTVWAYDKEGQLLSEQDPLGNTKSYTYDQMGNVASETAPDGGVTHNAYDLNGEQLSVTDASGAQSQATYDFMGRQITATTLERFPTAKTMTTNYSYASSLSNPGGGNLASVTTPDGATASYTYDWAGTKIASTDPAGNTTSYGYNFLGDPSTTTSPDGTKSELDYDANEQVTDAYSYDTDGTTLAHRKMSYDGAGNLLSATDADGNTTTYNYDASGLITQEIQPVSATSSITTSYGYDPAGNRTRYTDGRGNSFSTTYNSWGLRESEVEPSTTAYSTPADSTATFGYDADGQVTAQTAPGGITQSFTYDSTGDLLNQSGSGGSAATATRSFTYDKVGRVLTAATSNTGSGASNATSEAFTYDDRDDLLTASGTAGATTMAYDGDGLLTSRADAAGTTSYSYDSGDRLKLSADASTGTTLSYAYNSLNQVKQINQGTGNIRSFGYDGQHRLTSDTLATPGGGAVASIKYGYDPNGNLTSKNTSGFGASPVNNTYTYDRANRLSTWNDGTKAVNYGYDASGNRIQAGSNIYTYDARDQLTSDGINGYTYTAAGVLKSQSTSTGGTTSSYTSDAYGQTITAGTAAYTYDATGRMTARATSGATTNNFQYSGADDLLAADGQFTYSRDPGGGLQGVVGAGASPSTGQLVLTDLHTDVVGTASATATSLADTTTYDPLGNVVGSHTTAGNLGYQSEFTDPSTSQVNMDARWYNPAVGQFTSKDTFEADPSSNPSAANPFAYVGDNPLVGTDPSGHCSSWNLLCRAVNVVKSTPVYHAAANFVDNDIIRPASYLYNAYAPPFVKAAVHRAARAVHRIHDAYKREKARFKHFVHKEAKRLKHAVTKRLHAAAHAIHTAMHAGRALLKTAGHQLHAAAKAAGRATGVTQMVKAGGKFLKAHAAAITAFVVSTLVFAGCEAALTAGSAGTLSVPGAVACGAAAGAASSLVEQGFKCAGGGKGACSAKAFLTAGVTGGLAGAAGGLLGGVGSKVLGKLAPKALDAVGGLFGRGASEAGDSGVSDVADSAAGEQAEAADTAGSSSDNPSESARSSQDESAGGEDRQPTGCGARHSFAGATPVLMADGTSKAIDQIKVGDQISNAVPGQAGVQVHTVDNVIVTTTDHDFVDVTVKPGAQSPAQAAANFAAKAAATAKTAGNGKAKTAGSGKAKALAGTAKLAAAVALTAGVVAAGTGVTQVPADGATLTTTFHHPFYDQTQNAFVDAQYLHPGDVLQTPTGTASITTVRLYHATQTTYDLTIDGLHTYYVLAGAVAVLVHNCNKNIYRKPDEGVKHGNRAVNSSRGANSAEPTNGQAALDNSVQIKPTSDRRVGYDAENDEIVILDQTIQEPCGCGDEEDGMNNIFHGHVRSDFAKAKAMADARKALRLAFKTGAISR